uniref:lectin like domain-containing protein n=1 Tax=Agathobacter sp. TaxID=2021311 RepID=UPI003FEF90E4
MKNRMKKLIPVMLAAIVFAGNLVGTTQVQASEIESRTLDIYDAEVPAVEENTSSDGMRGAAQVPSAYHNTTAELHALYPATRSQGNYNTCWAFSGVGLAEFDLITDDKVADKSIDLSELQAAYFTYHSVDDAFGGMLADDVSLLSGNYMSCGGNMYYLSRALMQWKGLVRESDAPYTNVTRTISDSLAYQKDVAHLQNVYLMNIHKNPSSVKKAIIAHGAASIGFTAVDKNVYDQMVYYGPEGGMVATYRCDKKATVDHQAIVVGWDDNFPASAFKYPAKKNGAWLVRNSWSDLSDNSYYSYFWMSYEDASLEDASWVFDFEPGDNYDYNYQYDGAVYAYKVKSYPKEANVFLVKGSANQQLRAVSISMMQDANVPYTIKIYTNIASAKKPTSGILAAKVTGKTSYAGVYTIPLKKAVSIPKGTKYAVVVEFNKKNKGVDMECSGKNQHLSITAFSDYGQSFVYSNGSWRDLADLAEYTGIGNLCIKAYTDKTGTSIGKVKSVRAKAGKTSMRISWSKVASAKTYEVYRATSEKGTYKKVAIVKGKHYTDKKLSKGKTYYYKVRACKTNGKKSVAGALSDVKKATTKR